MLLTDLLQSLVKQTQCVFEISCAGSVCEYDADVLQGLDCLSLTLDSRECQSQGVFLAMLGSSVDGRGFIEVAAKQGVSAIFYEMNGLTDAQAKAIAVAQCACIGVSNLSQHASDIAAIFYGHPSENIQVYGVTGTNGKTSCAYLLAQSFNYLGFKTAFMGTIGVGLPNDLQVTTHTTLDAVSMQAYLASLLEQGFTHACIEVSSHALDQYRVEAVNFYAVLYTNLSQDHLDYHLTMQAYAAAKKRLFTEFSPTLAVINNNDEFGQVLLDVVNAEFVVTYGNADSVADAVAEDVSATPAGLSLVLESSALELALESRLLGLLNVPNIMLVATTLLALGVEADDIQKAIQHCQAAPGRMELFSQDLQPMVVVDYAHTPDAIQKALESCRVHCLGELWIVFGCGGDRDQSKRAQMGKIAEQYADVVMVCNDNPRSENPETIIADIVADMAQAPLVIADRSAAVAYAIQSAKADDLILLAGKGHETGQIIGDQIFPYSDRQWVKECLEVAA